MPWTIDEHIGEMRPWPEKVIVHRGGTDESLCYRPVPTLCGRCKSFCEDATPHDSENPHWCALLGTDGVSKNGFCDQGEPVGGAKPVDLVAVTRCHGCEHCTAASGSTTYETLYECHGPLVPMWDYYNDEPAHTYVPAGGFCMYGTPKTDGDGESEMC